MKKKTDDVIGVILCALLLGAGAISTAYFTGSNRSNGQPGAQEVSVADKFAMDQPTLEADSHIRPR